MTMWHPPESRAKCWARATLLTSTVFGRWCCQFGSSFIPPCIWQHLPFVKNSEHAHVLSMGLESMQTLAGMYQRSLNFCKQPAVVVVDVVLLTEIAETYGPRHEKGLIPGRDAVPPGPIVSCLWQDVIWQWETWQPQECKWLFSFPFLLLFFF